MILGVFGESKGLGASQMIRRQSVRIAPLSYLSQERPTSQPGSWLSCFLSVAPPETAVVSGSFSLHGDQRNMAESTVWPELMSYQDCLREEAGRRCRRSDYLRGGKYLPAWGSSEYSTSTQSQKEQCHKCPCLTSYVLMNATISNTVLSPASTLGPHVAQTKSYFQTLQTT